MKVRIPINKLQLDWPAFGLPSKQGIPITSYGYTTTNAEGPNYIFIVDPDADSWLDGETGALLPISEASLVVLFNGDAESRPITYTSFTVLDDKVQINLKSKDATGHSVRYYRTCDVYMEGEGFLIDDLI